MEKLVVVRPVAFPFVFSQLVVFLLYTGFFFFSFPTFWFVLLLEALQMSNYLSTGVL